MICTVNIRSKSHRLQGFDDLHLPELDASALSLLQSSLDLHRKSDEMQVLHMLLNASQVTKYLRISQSSFGIFLGLLDILSLSKPKAASSKLVMALRWLLSLGSFVAASSDAPEVVAPAGRLRGISDGEVHTFRGIPYAEAPVGALRWRPPVPLKPWQGVRASSPRRSTRSMVIFLGCIFTEAMETSKVIVVVFIFEIVST